MPRHETICGVCGQEILEKNRWQLRYEEAQVKWGEAVNRAEKAEHELDIVKEELKRWKNAFSDSIEAREKK